MTLRNNTLKRWYNMKLRDKRIEFTDMLASLLLHGMSSGMDMAIDWVKRDADTQAKLVNSGASKTMKSKHINALAVDILLFEDGEYLTDGDHPSYRELGEYWESIGGVWGGSWGFKDSGHFEWDDENG